MNTRRLWLPPRASAISSGWAAELRATRVSLTPNRCDQGLVQVDVQSFPTRGLPANGAPADLRTGEMPPFSLRSRKPGAARPRGQFHVPNDLPA